MEQKYKFNRFVHNFFFFFLQSSRVFVKPGDIVIAGTDGLFDNLDESDMVEIVNQGVKKAPHKLARKIAKLAHHNSLDRCAITPFSKAAQEAGLEFLGGKVEDITVVVAYIVTIVTT